MRPFDELDEIGGEEEEVDCCKYGGDEARYAEAEGLSSQTWNILANSHLLSMALCGCF